jgi:predicted transcriptional regulator
MARRVRREGPPALHELETEVMDALWSRGECSVRVLMGELNERTSRPRAYTTYMTIMSRLHHKGLLDRRRDGKTDFYTPALSREEYAERRSTHEVEALVEQFGDAALVSFARQIAEIDPNRRRELQRLAKKS